MKTKLFRFPVCYATKISDSDIVTLYYYEVIYADIISTHLVDSHLAGHDSHGTWLLPGYAREMKHGYVRWEEHEVVRENPCLQIIDGKGANGIVAVTKAAEIAVERAKQATFGFAGLSHVTHICRVRRMAS